MGFFRRFAQGLGHSTPVVGIAEAASSWGWEAVDDPFDDGTTDLIKGVVRTLHGVFRTMRPDDGRPTARMHYHDAYRGTRDGRAVTIANAWIAIEAVVAGGRHVEGAATTAVELSTLLMIGGASSRVCDTRASQGPRYRQATRPSIPPTASSGWLASPMAS